MKRLVAVLLVLVGLGMTRGLVQAADTLEEVKKKGVLVAGVKDSLPPFGYVDEATRQIVGYDIDFVKALVDKLGVKLDLKPVTSASRIAQTAMGCHTIFERISGPTRSCLTTDSTGRSSQQASTTTGS